MTTPTTHQLRSQRCRVCEGEAARLSEPQARDLLAALPGWERDEDGRQIHKQ